MIPLDIYPFTTINQSLLDINQSLDINPLTSINQTIGINDNMIQQSPPLALMEYQH
jgi:hypothetical protein